MTTVLATVANVRAYKPDEGALTKDDDVFQQFPTATADPTLRHAFCQGLRYSMRRGLIPIALTASTTAALKIASRSKMR